MTSGGQLFLRFDETIIKEERLKAKVNHSLALSAHALQKWSGHRFNRCH
jgi:hypothetical protein